jgi:hypothetical protein
MGMFYGLKVLNGDMYIEDVPIFWRDATQEWMDKNGTNSCIT